MEAALSELMTRLAELDSESQILTAAQGFQSLCNKELIQARDSFLKGITSVFIDIFFSINQCTRIVILNKRFCYDGPF